MDFISILSIFVMACFVGYYVVWSVTPALHTPLMAVTNAISSVIIVGALIAAAPVGAWGMAKILGLIAEAKRPVIYAGGGVISAGAHRDLKSFAEKVNIPVATTLMGVGGFPESHPLSMQWFSMLAVVITWRKTHMCRQVQFVVGIHGSMSG